ncbi:methyltransferase domain-containing protein [Microbacterium sp. Marseille-Q6648]|uniref:class I SAM-dependent methyltransferase n=1 Tax=Microbacterium sp. Marseille-Q6648 TaxID=2937991 RepID=UPI00203B0277|nr:methyltransferase domain-containing protein [Microbacterium sp. Marseille-Q6648]
MAEWSGTGRAYAESFARLCAGAVPPLLDAVESVRGAPAGGRLLDVGTGPGTVAGAASARGYAVVGVDPEGSMLAVARRRHPDVHFSAAALPDLPFEDGWFDVVTASFVLGHVADLQAAVAALARVCTGDGVVALTSWPSGRSPLRPLWEEVLARGGAVGYPPDSGPRGGGAERSAEGLADLLADAGLGRIRTGTLTWTFEIDPDDLWRGVAGGVATIGGIHRSLDDEGRRALRAVYDEVAGTRADSDGMLRVPHSAILAVGTRR